MSDGPYCPNCGTYLGRGYTRGDECLECFEEREEIADATEQKAKSSESAK